MLNIGGGEILVIALVALIVVGPEQLPGVLRKAGRYASQVRSMTSGIRDEFMAGIDEVDPTKWSNDIEGRGDGSAERPIVPRGYSDGHDEMKKPRAAYGPKGTSGSADPDTIKPKSGEMAAASGVSDDAASAIEAHPASDPTLPPAASSQANSTAAPDTAVESASPASNDASDTDEPT